MKKNNETEKNVYVQPVCKVVQVEIQQMITSSTYTPTKAVTSIDVATENMYLTEGQFYTTDDSYNNDKFYKHNWEEE